MPRKYDRFRHGRRSIRHPAWDYSNAGAYFITICAHRGQHIFGDIVDDGMMLSEIGQIVANEWLKMGELRTDHVVLDESVVMPNHFHAIVWILDDEQSPTAPSTPRRRDMASHVPTAGGDAIRQFGKPQPRSLSSIVGGFKSAVTKHTNILPEPQYEHKLWQRRFHDRIVRNDDELARIRQYIVDNPAKWTLDKLHPDAEINKFNRSWRQPPNPQTSDFSENRMSINRRTDPDKTPKSPQTASIQPQSNC